MLKSGLRRWQVAGVAVAGGAVLAAALERDRPKAEREEESSKSTVASIKQYPANRPIEDRCYMERLSNGAWWFSVFDGHGGWQCSDYASKNLHQNVSKTMAFHLGESNDDMGLFEGSIDRRVVTKALKSAFERTDRQYMVKVSGAFELGFGRDTRAGSCALGALVMDGVLFVANAGDSRAVLAVNRSGYEASTTGKKETSASKTRLTSAEAEVDLHGWNMDELMGQIALKDSVGEQISPELAEALRARLLNQIYELKQAEKEKGQKGDDVATTASTAASAVTADTNVKKQASNRASAESKNPFVTAVRMLTGGQGEEQAVVVESEFVAIDMSNDHNCREPRERDLLERTHPGEKDVVICRVNNPDQCYIKGKLQPTRAFGDFYLKYSEFMRDVNEDSAAGRYVPPPYTPPYITATPEVQVRTLRKGVDEFLVMATDGLWDLMSSQEAIDIASTQLRKPGGTPAEASEVLVEEALRRAARAHGMTAPQLKALKAGRARRSKHDDISVIVVDLAKLIEMHYWG